MASLEYAPIAMEDRNRARIARVLDHIHGDLDGDLGLEALAARSGLSPFYFHRLFRGVVGEAPAAYVRRLRLERSALRLRYRGGSVSTAAFEAGYETHESFTRAFAAAFGVCPRRFRDEAPPQPASLSSVRVERLPSRTIAYLRRRGPYDRIVETFGSLCRWAHSRHGFEPDTAVGVYWDDQCITPAERTRYEGGVCVPPQTPGEGEIRVRRLPGGSHAVVRLSEPYSVEAAREAYRQIYGCWLPASGRRVACTAPHEVYPLTSAPASGNVLLSVPLASSHFLQPG